MFTRLQLAKAPTRHEVARIGEIGFQPSSTARSWTLEGGAVLQQAVQANDGRSRLHPGWASRWSLSRGQSGSGASMPMSSP